MGRTGSPQAGSVRMRMPVRRPAAMVSWCDR